MREYWVSTWNRDSTYAKIVANSADFIAENKSLVVGTLAAVYTCGLSYAYGGIPYMLKVVDWCQKAYIFITGAVGLKSLVDADSVSVENDNIINTENHYRKIGDSESLDGSSPPESLKKNTSKNNLTEKEVPKKDMSEKSLFLRPHYLKDGKLDCSDLANYDNNYCDHLYLKGQHMLFADKIYVVRQAYGYTCYLEYVPEDFSYINPSVNYVYNGYYTYEPPGALVYHPLECAFFGTSFKI